ncbi:Uncharacterised protein [uncultured archaeon]|nr:Uncharacterised protein [uncultured archaeon]
MGTTKEKTLAWVLLIFGLIFVFGLLSWSGGELGITGWISMAVIILMMIIYPLGLLKGAYNGSKK